MPAQQPPREPSMEEILASIRRIIAEDGPSPEVGRPAGGAPRAPAGAVMEQGAPEVLDLTELVEETPRPADDPLVLTDFDEPAPPPPAPAPAPVAIPAPVATPTPVATPEVVVRRAAPPPPVTPPPEPKTVQPQASPPAPAPTPVAVPANAAPPAAAPPGNPTPAGPPQRPATELVTPRAQDQATAALADLARVVRQDKQKAQPPARSPLEALVLEALRPSLKAWMEQNLAPLVERVVREEVRRLTKRIEDQ